MGRSNFADLSYGAMVYDLGRWLTFETSVRTSAIRVLTVLQGAWVARTNGGCNATAGRHADECLHSENEVPYSTRWLARQAFGHDGSSQRELVSVALTTFRGLHYQSDVNRHSVKPVLGLAGAPSAPGAPADTAIWHPAVQAQLMAGHFQLIPMSLVRLKGREAFLVWLYVLMKPGTARVGREGTFRDFAVSGPNAYAVEDLRLRSLSPADLRRTLERCAAAGNLAQAAFHLEVVDRACGGLKVRLTRPGVMRDFRPARRRRRARSRPQGRARAA